MDYQEVGMHHETASTTKKPATLFPDKDGAVFVP